MLESRKIIRYPEASIRDLDAGTVVAYPIGRERFSYYAVPSFLIIGAQKCGTRELFTWLDMHPNLRGAPQEFHFFNDAMDVETEWTRYVFSPSYLLSKDKEHLSAKPLRTFEKTPAYFDCDNRGTPVPELVRKMMPSGKFIALLRNPTERAYSAWQMGGERQRFEGPFPEYRNQDFTSLVKAGLEKPERTPAERLINIGRYASHLVTWLRYFSREQILILCLEDFKRDPLPAMDKTLSFLGLPAFDYERTMEKNFRGLWVQRGRTSKGNDHPYEPMPEEARTLLDAHYLPWNRQLQLLLPELDLPW